MLPSRRCRRSDTSGSLASGDSLKASCTSYPRQAGVPCRPQGLLNNLFERMIEAMRPHDAPAELAPPVALSSGPLGEVQAADREIARQTALRARAVAEFAASRPASADRAQGEPGAMSAERWTARPDVLRPVSEWAAAELSV